MLSAARPAGRPPGLPVSFAWQGPPRSPRSRAAAGRRAAIAQRPLRVEGRPRSVRGADRRTTAPASHTGGPWNPAGSVVHDGQRPAPAGQFPGDGDVGDDRSLLPGGEHLPAVLQPLVPGVAAGPRRRRRLVPTGPHGEPGTVGLAGCQAASTSSRRAWVFPVLVIEPWERCPPEEDSVGTSPR